jgi:hypothetical protein
MKPTQIPEWLHDGFESAQRTVDGWSEGKKIAAGLISRDHTDNTEQTNNYQWHLDQANKLQEEIRILKLQLKRKQSKQKKHLDDAHSLMQGQLTFEEIEDAR